MLRLMRLGMIYALVLLTLCAHVLAERPVPTFSSKCQSKGALADYNEKTFTGKWYETVSSSNIPFKCPLFHTYSDDNHQFYTLGKVILLNETQVTKDIFWQTAMSPEINARAMDIYEGYFYHMVEYPLDYTDKEMLVCYACEEIDGKIQESIHVYTSSLNYNKTHLAEVLKAHDIDTIPTKEQFTDCPDGWDF